MAEDGWHATGWVRSVESAALLLSAGMTVVTGDVTDADTWTNVPRTWDAVVYCAAGAHGEPERYRSIYADGVKQAVAQLTKGTPFIFTSSTAVYEQTDGGWVNEESETPGSLTTTRALLEGEARTVAAGGTVLRLAGIYGPGRTYALRAWDKGPPQLDGDGSRWMNMIHRDDIAGAVWHVLQCGAAGVYNVCDDEPVRQVDFLRWLAGRLRKPEALPGGEPRDRKRGLTSKRVSNEKLQALGWIARYPNFVEGYEAVISGTP
jgi:nucleoside-diphosphate-sugar epimerase